jgi:hypothetical protein
MLSARRIKTDGRMKIAIAMRRHARDDDVGDGLADQ